MARKRLIAPEFFKHGSLFDAEQSTGLPLRLAFAGLWCQADKEGRFKWRPRELKLDILPYDSVDFGAVLSALQSFGFVHSYVVGNEAFGVIPSFGKWQTFHRTERPSTLPPPLDNGYLTVTYTAVTGTDTITGTVTDTNQQPTTPPSAVPAQPAVKAKPVGGEPSPEFLQAWAEYPKRPGNSKADALKAWTARVREGCRAEDMLEGTKRYAAYVKASGTEPRYVKMAATFFGPGKHFEADYAYTAPPKAEDALYAQIAAEANDLSGYVV